MTHAQLKAYVRERDGCCMDCGAYATEVHHVVRRNLKGAWDIRNMILLCAKCHRLKGKQGAAHTHKARLKHIKQLMERYGYDYSDMRSSWQELVREIEG